MIQVFLGYRNVMGHVIKKTPAGSPEGSDFTDEIREWCDYNLSGPCWPIYVVFDSEDPDEKGRTRTYGRFEFKFQNDHDAALFKMFWIGTEHT